MGCALKGGGGLYSRLTVGAVLLAAGAGERMGRRPKCMLQLGGVPIIRRMLIAMSGAGVDEVVVVLGHHAEVVEPAVMDFPVTVVHNPAPDDGIMSSQRIGLAALSRRYDAVLMALADQPLIGADDITALIRAWKQRPEGVGVVFPQVAGQKGNPVLVSADVRDQILADGANVGCRQWREWHPELVMPFVTDCRRYCIDVDTPEDVERFSNETGHALRWPTELAV
ncbi:nucleotidyltransferase family protein [Methylibium sp.]|uniref:nucleotidyltransferase family protein n=1 Tax=Methylibium sp. TaxID=2067992 RepID=UPI003D116FA2